MMHEPSVVVSIIIVNWKVREFLRRCLDSLRPEVDSRTEVIVIDNDSQDGSIEMLGREYPWVVSVSNSRNLGHGAAMNQGSQLARGDILVFSNPDVIFGPGCIRALKEFMLEHPGAGAATAKVLDRRGQLEVGTRRRRYDLPSLVCDALGVVSPHSDMFPRLDHYLTNLPENLESQVDAISGVLFVVRRAVFDRTGGFDLRMNNSCQDIDLSHRIQSLGFSLHYVPRAFVTHFHGQSTKQWRRFRGVQYIEKAIYLERNYGLIYAALHIVLLPWAVYSQYLSRLVRSSRTKEQGNEAL